MAFGLEKCEVLQYNLGFDICEETSSNDDFCQGLQLLGVAQFSLRPIQVALTLA